MSHDWWGGVAIGYWLAATVQLVLPPVVRWIRRARP